MKMNTFGVLVCAMLALGMANGFLFAEDGQHDYCMTSPGTYCADGGPSAGHKLKVLAPNAQEEGLVGWWTFDDAEALDASGHRNHAKKGAKAGPGFRGVGASARFSGSLEDMVEIPHSAEMESEDMTVSFWIYLRSSPMGVWSPIFRKGNFSENLTPSLFLWPQSSRLHARVTTNEYWNEGEDSHALIPRNRWTHVAVVVEGMLMRIYINGLMDSEAVMKGIPVANKGPLYIGRDLVHPGAQSFIDDFKFYSRALTSHEIAAQAFLTLGGIGPEYARLGCYGHSCTYEKASAACPDKYHMCGARELRGGGYFVARANGWLALNKDVWAHDCDKEERGGSRLGLCCQD